MRGHVLLTLAVFAYPFVVHFSVISGHPEWSVALLLLILSLGSGLRFCSGCRLWLLLVLVFGWIFLFAFPGDGWNIVPLMMPSLVFGVLAWLFARSLLGDNVPAVTRFARALRDTTTPQVEHYTRMATIAWAFFFSFMVLQAALLALFAPVHLWSLLVNFISYGMILLMFFAEYLFRRIYLHREPQYGVGEYLRRLRHVDFRKLMDS